MVNRAGTIWAIQDSCPHQGASLASGTVDGLRLACHRHDWVFDLRTGRETSRGRACAHTYPARIQDGDVLLEVDRPDDAPPDDDWVVWDADKHLR